MIAMESPSGAVTRVSLAGLLNRSSPRDPGDLPSRAGASLAQLAGGTTAAQSSERPVDGLTVMTRSPVETGERALSYSSEVTVLRS